MHNPIRIKRKTFYSVIAALLIATVACAAPGIGGGQESATEAPPAAEEDTEDAAPTADADEAPTSTPEPSATFTPDPTATYTPTPDPTAQAIGSVTASGGGYTGRGVIDVPVSNPGDEPIEITLPPGYVFLPPEGSDQQRLMVIKEETITLQPGEEATLDPFVVCIDADQGAPEGGATYQPAGVVGDDSLQQFAQCLSEQEDLETGGNPLMSGIGLQFAIWSVSDDYSPEEWMEALENPDLAPEGAAGELMTPEMQEMMGTFFEQFASGSDEWLERCDIQTEGEG